ncbi:MAG: hypothetical protein AB3N14_05265 [Flavobacteriaceae bacterium]
MKPLISTVLLLSGFTLCCQSESAAGEYFKSMGDKEDHYIEYELVLDEEGTFRFHAYENHKRGISWERNKYGKGSWTQEGKIVSFFTDRQKDMDEKYTLNFSDSRARFITKPLRDKTHRIIKTRLQFFESEIFCIERLKILKVIPK